MSSETTPPSIGDHRGELSGARESTRRWHGIIRALSFWSAIALPALYLPLVMIGIETTQQLVVFLGLFGIHIATLLGGHSYMNDG